MNILLIAPSQLRAYGVRIKPPYPSLGLLWIGAVLLDAGHRVRFIDVDAQGMSLSHLSAESGDFKPGLACITGTSPSHPDMLDAASAVKSGAHWVKVVAGGPHASAVPLELLQHPSIDFVIAGEGESAVVALADAVAEGEPAPEIDGLYRKSGDEIFSPAAGIARIPDMNLLPFPARDLVPPDARYAPPDAYLSPIAHVLASRGCPWNCGFCASRTVFGRKLRYRDASNVLEEIESCAAEHGTREIHFADDSITESKEWILSFCDEAANRLPVRSFMFMNGLRADRVDREILEALRSIGTRNLGFGIESGDPELRRTMGKNLDMDAAERNIRLAGRLGFDVWLFFLFGYPGETDHTARRTLELAKSLDPAFAKFMIVKPFPGTRLRERLVRDGLLEDSRYERLGIYTPPVHSLPGMTGQRMMWWLRKANRSFYLRPGKLARHLVRAGNPGRLIRNFAAFRFVFRLMFRK